MPGRAFDDAPKRASSPKAVVRPRDPGIAAIIGYKILKGSLGGVLALVLLVLLLVHKTAPLEEIGTQVHHHFTGAWSVALSRVLLSAAEPHHLWFVTAALAMDATLTLTEGWALYHGHWWGPWLVVAATASLLPFEVMALVHKLHAGRLVVFAVNVGIVVYLVARTRKDHKKGIVRAQEV